MSSHPLEALSAYLDDELEDAERRDVAAHLASCASCAQHLRELSAVDSLARDMPPAGAPAGYHEALPGRVRRRIRSDRPLSARAPWVWPLAAALALAVLAPIVLQQGRDRPAAPEPAAMAPAPPASTVAEAPAKAVRSKDDDADTLDRMAGLRQDAPRRAPAPPPAARPAEEPAPAEDARASEMEAAHANQAAGAAVLRDEAPAAQPGFAPPPAAAQEAKQAKAQVQERDRALGAVAAPLSKKEDAGSVSAEERAFRAVASLPLSTAGQARHARGAWLRFLADHPRAERRDEALVRVVEASVVAFRDGADPGDRVRAQQDAAAYLSQPEAPQAARVKAALGRLDDPR